MEIINLNDVLSIHKDEFIKIQYGNATKLAYNIMCDFSLLMGEDIIIEWNDLDPKLKTDFFKFTETICARPIDGVILWYLDWKRWVDNTLPDWRDLTVSQKRKVNLFCMTIRCMML